MSVPDLAFDAPDIGLPEPPALRELQTPPSREPLELAATIQQLGELARTVQREAAEADVVQRAALSKAEDEFQSRREALLARFTSARQAIDVEAQMERTANAALYDSEHDAAQRELQLELEAVAAQYEETCRKAAAVRKEALWELAAVYEANKKGQRTRIEEAQKVADAAQEQLDGASALARRRLQSWRQSRVAREVEAQLRRPRGARDLQVPTHASPSVASPEAPSGGAPTRASEPLIGAQVAVESQRPPETVDVTPLPTLAAIPLPDESPVSMDAASATDEEELDIPLPSADETESATSDSDPVIPSPQTLVEGFARIRQALADLDRLRLPPWFSGARPMLLAAAGIAVVAAAGWAASFSPAVIAGACLASAALTVVGGAWLYRRARVAVRERYAPLLESIFQTEKLRRRALRAAYRTYGEGKEENKRRRAASTAAADEAYRQSVREALRRRDVRLSTGNDRHMSHMSDLTRRRDRASRLVEDSFLRRASELKQQYEIDWHAMQDVYETATAAAVDGHSRKLSELTARWREKSAAVVETVEQLNDACDRLFPDWNSPAWEGWTHPDAAPPVVPFGRLNVDPAVLLEGQPADERFPIPPLSLPAVLTFPERGSLVIRARGPARAAAIETLQAVMLRMLASMPAGKVRFTILDPVGLGENFSAFMHLADYDEQLVNSRIWTEPSHIEQRLADLTEQMESIIQKYLRNEYATITEYNAQAGEIAEPLRILVAAGFPANFSEAAARRLLSIAASGPRCGVYVLLAVDAALPLPPGISLADLQAKSANAIWRDGAFHWQEGEFARHALELARPPSPEVCTQRIREAGEHALQASRVEVPFKVVAPADDAWWTASSAEGVRVPLGPCGATRRQWLKLGEGTSQHMLVAGKTGSGKSTLWHALITNLALHYAPDQVQLYLIDFKKGVEFKAYAARALPHARVVAIESDREFGMSVLERLDAELKARGDAYRAAGVQDVRGFRQARPNEPLPRLLLIVDEFQEFFVEDDKLSQQAALLLDRLVRQGRAFGIHILLGSQTLAGAYSLARSTIGQMAVRIALACSEADAHLILSEENTAARLLSRPGEAIYNDAGGLLEGNHPFQIAWLNDEQRERYLIALNDRATKTGVSRPETIIYEGNVPADLSRNERLREFAAASGWPTAPGEPRAWLGDAVAIKDPTSASFGPHSGSHLLLVGQHETAAQGILSAAIVSLAAQHAPAPWGNAARVARFAILDGGPAEGESYALWSRLAATLPHVVQVGGRRDMEAILGELYDEVQSRQKESAEGASTRFLVLYDLGKLRDLRRDEDDFGMAREEPGVRPSPARQLAFILREGPAAGAHVLCWCDSLNNLQRTFDRQTLREFEQRVLFQMSAGDSSHLIDTPAASRLGMHRALLSAEQEGRMEKFRPYAAPDGDWLERLREQFVSRHE